MRIPQQRYSRPYVAWQRAAKEELNLRTLLSWICILMIAPTIGGAQQELNQARRRFDPASVVAVTEPAHGQSNSAEWIRGNRRDS